MDYSLIFHQIRGDNNKGQGSSSGPMSAEETNNEQTTNNTTNKIGNAVH